MTMDEPVSFYSFLYHVFIYFFFGRCQRPPGSHCFGAILASAPLPLKKKLEHRFRPKHPGPPLVLFLGDFLSDLPLVYITLHYPRRPYTLYQI